MTDLHGADLASRDAMRKQDRLRDGLHLSVIVIPGAVPAKCFLPSPRFGERGRGRGVLCVSCETPSNPFTLTPLPRSGGEGGRHGRGGRNGATCTLKILAICSPSSVAYQGIWKEPSLRLEEKRHDDSLSLCLRPTIGRPR